MTKIFNFPKNDYEFYTFDKIVVEKKSFLIRTTKVYRRFILIEYRNLVGKFHRFVDKPAIIYRRVTDQGVISEIICEIFCSEGLLHREGDEPAYTCFQETSGNKGTRIMVKKYFKNNICHRDSDKPAFILHYRNFSKQRSEIQYIKDGLLDRDNHPALFIYNDGKLESEHFYKKGLKHRDNCKPASLYYHLGKGKIIKDYFEEGRHL